MERHIVARSVSPYIWPHHDACLRGEAMMCQFWPPGTGICGCTIGALGWLRACRQAYVEGIEVLYSTNTFVVESRDLLDSLLRSADCGYILLQQHLATIKSLELRLEVLLFGDASQPRFTRKSDMDKMRRQLPNLAGLTTAFPDLHSLVISFSDYLYNDWDVRPAARLLDIDRLLLRPLAAALGHLMTEQETHVVVELPSNVFRDLGGLKLKEEPRGDEWGDGKGLWLRYPTESSYYWIKQGVESDLFWDCEGRPRRLSNIVNNTDRHHTHLT
ncbi:hypothetical protein C8035_v006224 [Colletotrichum spinosum]|uniref:DUF7730 domain-containing protein n=1 Tax=Colletotrichum spinosum TaxID=1347390 RepID=A0A4R8QB34_9PEZI|nr:hypothetical protein C8035_v006224 [Colletotrichum spinosum]